MTDMDEAMTSAVECKILLVEFFNSLEIIKREEHEYKRVRVKILTNLCSCAQISLLEKVLVG